MQRNREWLMIIAGGIVLLLVVLIVAICSGLQPLAPDDPREPELEETETVRRP